MEVDTCRDFTRRNRERYEVVHQHLEHHLATEVANRFHGQSSSSSESANIGHTVPAMLQVIVGSLWEAQLVDDVSRKDTAITQALEDSIVPHISCTGDE